MGHAKEEEALAIVNNRGIAPLATFDPMRGELILPPERGEPGYWVGCPSVLLDDGRFYLTYRQRRPRGAAAERGWRCAVAVSDDGVSFRDVWSVEKAELGTDSMERFCLQRDMSGGYRLYMSYVDPLDNRWRIDVLHADDPAGFQVSNTKAVLTADSTGTEGVKDPYVWQIGPVTYLFASCAERVAGLDPAAHATADIYNVGATTHPTGMATSLDGVSFTWHGAVLGTGSGWDRYQSRLNSIVPVGGGYVGFYDGSAGHEENYEERCGVAVSFDLAHWQRLSTEQPWVTSPFGTGSVRYVDALLIDDTWWIYFEMARADGAHELRLARVAGK